jgi:hypothetical protein
VVTVQADMRRADAAVDLLCPSYWLVSGLEWQGDGGLVEAAMAVAPGMIPRDALSHDTRQVLGCADLYSRKHCQRVVFFSDLTRMFTKAGTSWSQLGVDWEGALRELRAGEFPVMLLTVSERAHISICNPAIRPMAITPEGGTEEAADDRELVRQAISRQLVADWPLYMQGIVDADRVRSSGMRSRVR